MCTRLAPEIFSAVYASDLGRAHRTASLIANGRAITTTPALRERSFGEGEGLTYPALEAKYPGAFSRERMLDADYRIEGGESRRDLALRIEAELVRITQVHANERVLVVTHGGVLAAVWRFLHGHPPSSPHSVEIPNVGYNHIRYQGGAWHIMVWGDTQHLTRATLADAV
jgi:probable phosphoglycerate mutase